MRSVTASMTEFKRLPLPPIVSKLSMRNVERRTGIHDRRTKKRVYDHGCVCSRHIPLLCIQAFESGLV